MTKDRKIIFDSSAVIALLVEENGSDKIKSYLSSGVISSVNASEVYKHCIEKQGLSVDEGKAVFNTLSIEVIEFTDKQALIAAGLVLPTKKLGISFADRACIALAIDTGCPVLTCDRIWDKLKINPKVKIILAREGCLI